MIPQRDNLSYLSGGDLKYLTQLYVQYLENPSNIDPKLAEAFRQLGDEVHDLLKEQTGPSWTPAFKLDLANPLEDAGEKAPTTEKGNKSSTKATSHTHQSIDVEVIRLSQIAYQMVDAYRRYGHFAVQLDPLSLSKPIGHPELELDFYKLSSSDLQKTVILPDLFGDQAVSLQSVRQWAQATYCNAIGYDYAHITNASKRLWLQQRIEHPQTSLGKEDKKAILQGLIKSDGLERFLHVKFPGAKRFGLEGNDALIPLLESILRIGVRTGISEVVLGMAHRGRLNVLTNVMGKPYGALFSEFKFGVPTYPEFQASGDVKYHMGISQDRTIDGASLHLTLMPNPSHLEAVNPLVLGKVRARQDELGNDKVLSILVHGDASFAGQGVVSETLAMSQLTGYSVQGSLHIVVNNQVGFTTNPQDSRSTHYCSDLVRGIDIPVLHVNADMPESVIQAGQLAMEFRQTFKSDVVIDLVGFRRHGHNEGDEPVFTQPMMYDVIAKHPPARQLYAEQLVSNGEMTLEEITAEKTAFDHILNNAFEQIEHFKNPKPDWLRGHWSHIKIEDDATPPATGIKLSKLKTYGKILTTAPDGFQLNPKIARQLENKRHLIESGDNIDWATGESLAFAALLDEGFPVRLTGQDCERGTFSHRHVVWIDQVTEQKHTNLKHIRKDQPSFTIINSLLSEESVVGFEYGYAYSNPNTLVIWEAQFGDFANGAQVYADQFISSAESKWLRKNGLVLLLPHGFEGQGPEHSSARLERYLQLCAQGNMRVVNCTTPANYFHVLRRQLHSQTRKPLIMMTPKSLLRHKMAVSSLADFADNTSFQPVLFQENRKDIKKIVFCSGKVYYDLLTTQNEMKKTNVLLVRLEQLYPFPTHQVSQILKSHEKAQLVWCQEEPKNMGAWNFIASQFADVVINGKDPIQYAGRPEAASPAVGSDKIHIKEQQQLVEEALK